MIYVEVGFDNSPQLASSDPSAQSGSSSQTQSLEMQCIEALHWNWSGEQVLSAGGRETGSMFGMVEMTTVIRVFIKTTVK